jgi:hypothetical protein
MGRSSWKGNIGLASFASTQSDQLESWDRQQKAKTTTTTTTITITTIAITIVCKEEGSLLSFAYKFGRLACPCC